jgi:hypothetical protein
VREASEALSINFGYPGGEVLRVSFDEESNEDLFQQVLEILKLS